MSIKKWDNFLPSICRNSEAKSHFAGMLFFLSLALSLLYSFFFVSEISWNTIYKLWKKWLQLNHQQFDIPTDVSQLLCDLISFAYVFQFNTFVNYLQINTLIRVLPVFLLSSNSSNFNNILNANQVAFNLLWMFLFENLYKYTQKPILKAVLSLNSMHFDCSFFFSSLNSNWF